MSISSGGKPRALLLVLPIALYLLGSGWIMLTASRVYEAGGCSLGGPWSFLPSADIVQTLFPTSWADALTLRRLSSACIASLHVEIVSGYMLSFGIAAFITAIGSAVLIHVNPYVPRHSLNHLARSAVTFLVVGSALLFTVYGYGHLMSFIAFDGTPSKTQLRFDGAYIGIVWFWWRITGLSILGMLEVMSTVTGATFLIYVAQFAFGVAPAARR